MLNWPWILYYLLKSRGNLRKSRKILEQYQSKRLRYMIKHAYNSVPFYRTLFKENNVFPSDVRSINDLHKIPIIRKQHLRNNKSSDLISENYDVTKLNTLITGGSTGIPLSTFISDQEKCWRTAIQLRANLSVGQKPHYTWTTIDTVEHFERHRESTPLFPHTSIPVLWNPATQLNFLQSIKPDVLDGLSSALWLIAKEINEKGKSNMNQKLVFGTGELVNTSSREAVEIAFNSKYYDQLSCTEVGRTAWECNENMGYHMNVDSAIMQFVDGEDEEVSSGERGEIVYTSLHNFAMPIIRYGIEDVGVPIDGTCSCGVNLPLMKVIEGRQNSFLVFPNGNIVSPSRFIEALGLFTLTHEIKKYRIIQTKKDFIKILIVKSNEEVDEEKIREWIEYNLTKEFSEETNLSEIIFDIRFTNSIPSTRRGKLNVITSKLKDVLIF